jgi:hypothetical protein
MVIVTVCAKTGVIGWAVDCALTLPADIARGYLLSLFTYRVQLKLD